MSAPPPSTNSSSPLFFHASSGFQSEHYNAPPPPGVSAAPPAFHKPNFSWSPSPGLTHMPAPTHSPEVIGGVHPQQASMQRNFMNVNENLQSWPLRSNIQSPGVFPGIYVHQTLASQAGFSYGLENAGYGAQNFSHGSTTCGVHNTMMPTFSLEVQDPCFIQKPPVESGSMHGNDASRLNKVDKIDMKDLIPKLRVLITQVNESVGKILSMLKIRPDTLPFKGLDPIAVGSAGSHFASHSIAEDCVNHRASWDSSQGSDDFTKASTIFSNILISSRNQKILDDVCYKDAPGVVQVPVYTVDESFESSNLPDFAMGERWDELTPQGMDALASNRQAHRTLLPSVYWLVSKQISEWKDLPLKLTPYQLKAMAGLDLVQQADLQKFLLTHGRSYGVSCSGSLAEHIILLLVFCLRAVYREATASINSGQKVGMVDISVLSQSAGWLSAQLSLLYDVASSKSLVIGLYKFALRAAAYCSIISSHRGSLKDSHEKKSSMFGNDKRFGVSLEQESHDPSCKFSGASYDQSNGSSYVGDGVLCLQHLAAAILAIQAQAACDKCRASNYQTFSTYQRASEHSMVTHKAAEERAARENYRAVLEHDGLIWQRSHNQESKRNKTKEELLAEERDYKRRRMSYRGKRAQRTPAEVLRDIIEGHMADIVAAGGIGCIGRRTQDVQLPELESVCRASDTSPMLRSISRDTPGMQFSTSRPNCNIYSRAESRDSFGAERAERHRSNSVSLSSSRQRHDQTYQERFKRSHDHFDDNSSERMYESIRDNSG